eukprot:Colp12_sorted_trinity150504_noHs@4335
MADFSNNFLLLADSYKASHYRQYPANTTKVYSYFESRGGVYPEVVFYGLQYILKRYFEGVQVTEEKIQQAKEFCALHFGDPTIFNEEGWRYILEKHGGKLPLLIKAVPEGTVVPTHNVLFTVENTDPHCAWLSNYVETILVQVWYPTTIATSSRGQKKTIAKWLHKTADNMNSLHFKLHDFGFRGVSSVETAAIGASAHLVNFKGTDTVAGIMLARQYYDEPMAGFSIPAAEHSTITSWGREREKDACRNMLDRFPTGMVAVVSDSYNIWETCENIWGGELKDKILARNGTLVVRPDSGDPVDSVHRVLEILGSKFGTTPNSKDFKMLPSQIRVIQGDGIDAEMIDKICQRLYENKWSAENVAFGSGGALLQKFHRDTQKCAYKCSFAVVDGKPVNVYKEPITDLGKKSKRGRLSLHKVDGKFVTIEEGLGDPATDLLVPVFQDGSMLRHYTFSDVRARAELEAGDY